MTFTDHYAGMRHAASSSEARALLNGLSAELENCPKHTFVIAVDALLADLLKAASIDPECYCFRELHDCAFTGHYVGSRGYKRALALLEGAGYLKRVPAVADPSAGIMRATRFRATRALFEKAEAAGVSISAWGAHFYAFPRPKSIREPIRKMTASKRDGTWTKIAGKKCKIDPSDAKAEVLAKQVNEINAFMAEQAIVPDWHYAFWRIFNEADNPAFDWNRGGRLYSIGASYQQRKSHERATMTLNGEPVVEIDVKACFPTILHALRGVRFDPREAYDVLDIHREAVKLWFVSTLSKPSFTQKWTAQNKRDFRAKTGLDLGEIHPAKSLIAPIVKAHPLLADWPSSPYRWSDLQFHESAAMTDCVHTLAITHGVPALPIFDSVIVPVSNEALAKEVLMASFERQIGVRPIVETKAS